MRWRQLERLGAEKPAAAGEDVVWGVGAVSLTHVYICH